VHLICAVRGPVPYLPTLTLLPTHPLQSDAPLWEALAVLEQVGGRIGGLPARTYIAAAWTTADCQHAHLREQVISLAS
jgi:hypothetical protein